MAKRFPLFRLVSCYLSVATVWIALAGLPGTVRGADATFVGLLALAIEDDVAKQLSLLVETREKLIDLINRREREALNLASELRELPPSEAAKQLEPFVAESERLGFELLSIAQRGKLQQVRVARAGMMSLLEPHVAQVLSLSDDQIQKIARLAEQRSADLGRGGETQRRLAAAMYERNMAAVLSANQRATWEQLAGLSAGGGEQVRPAARPDPATTAAADAPGQPASDEPLDREPAVVHPGAIASPTTQPVPTRPADSLETHAISGRAPFGRELPGDLVRPSETTIPETTRQPASPQPASRFGTASDLVREFDEESTTIRPADQQPHDDKLRFSFVHTPWADVIEWFAEEAGLALQRDTMPPGTFNYKDPRAYTPSEALDLMNSLLLTKGYTLLRRNNMLMVIDLENVIPPELIELVPLEELDNRGSYELVKTLFQLARMTPEQAQADISLLLGPQGKVTVMPSAQQVLVQETAGKLRTIRAMIERVEDPTTSLRKHNIVLIQLQDIAADDLLQIARPLLGLGEDQNVGPDISIAVDPLGTRIFASGTSDMLQRLEQVVKLVDKPSGGSAGAASAVELPYLETYTIVKATPETALAVLQTLLAGMPDVRLAIDPATNKLIAFARPSEHRVIVETLRQLAGQAEQFEVIKLRRIDPQVVVLMAQKFFPGGAAAEGSSPTGPVLDGDPISMQLWVRGTAEQVGQVRDLVEKLEGPPGDEDSYGDTVRILPFTGRSARSALEQAENFWPAMQRENRIRIVTPSAISPTMNGVRTITKNPQGELAPAPRPSSEATFPPAPRAAPVSPVRPAEPAGDSETRWGGQPSSGLVQRVPSRKATLPAPSQSAPFRLVQFRDEDSAERRLEPNANDVRSPSDSVPSGVRGDAEASRVPEILVSITPTGIIIASEDKKALDDFERLLRSIMDSTGTNNQEPVIFWLKFARAEPTAELLREILGASGGTAGDGGGSLLGDMASSMLGDIGGGLLGNLLGGGGGGAITTSGDMSIVADTRLNALIVQANPADLDLIEQLLQVFDTEASPENPQTHGRPRLIPIIYTSAEEVAAVVKGAYANRVAGAEAQGGNRQPNAQDLMQMLRGGGGGRGGRGGGNREGSEEAKLTISVDRRSNSLIVTAPEPLFQEVRELVETIDQAGLNPDQTVEVVRLGGNTNTEVIQRALKSILGPSATTTNAAAPTAQAQSPGAAPSGGERSPDDIRRSIEMFRSLQQQGGGGGSPFGAGGGSPFGGRGSTGGAPTRGGGSTRGGSSRGAR